MKIIKEKVGIVVPSYNQGKYLEETIQSIIENMENANIEFVVIDGGSTDNSLDIIKKYERYIKYWQSKPDGGQAAAINEGVNYLENCDYIMWLNSDDVYESEYAVSKILLFAVLGHYKVCYGKSYFINEKGEHIGSYPTQKFDKKVLKKACYLSQPSVIVRKDVWKEMGGLNPNLRMCLDYEMWIRLSQKYDFGYLEDEIGNTRIYNDTKTAKMQHRNLNEAICIIYKHYGSVPIHWIYSKVLLETKYVILKKLPKKVVKLFLLPRKRLYIKKALLECGWI